MKQEEFLQLPLSQLTAVISSDVLDVRSEEQVYEAVMSWIKHNKDERRCHLLHILKHVRFHLMTPEVLDRISRDDLIQSDKVCREIVIQAKKVLQLPQGERPQMAGRRLKMGHVLMIAGGEHSLAVSNSVEICDPQTGKWKMMPAFPSLTLLPSMRKVITPIAAFSSS